MSTVWENRQKSRNFVAYRWKALVETDLPNPRGVLMYLFPLIDCMLKKNVKVVNDRWMLKWRFRNQFLHSLCQEADQSSNLHFTEELIYTGRKSGCAIGDAGSSLLKKDFMRRFSSPREHRCSESASLFLYFISTYRSRIHESLFPKVCKLKRTA